MSGADPRRPLPLAAALAGAREELAGALAAWLPDRRWFAGKARTLREVRVADLVELGPTVALVVAETVYDRGDPERYLVPLAERAAGGDLSAAGRALVDAMRHPHATLVLARAARDAGRRVSHGGAVVTGIPLASDVHVGPPVRPLGVEQSNSSAVLGDRFVCKLFRRLEPGPNPEVELTAALTRAGCPYVPAQRGALLWDEGGAPMAAAVLTDLVEGAQEGWRLATTAAGRLLGGEARDAERLRRRMRDLGGAVADVHVRLAEALPSRPAGARQTAEWARSMQEQLDRVLRLARQRDPERTAGVTERTSQLRRRLSTVATVHRAGVLARIHGDLHLGQVLLDASGRWQLLDFEGEPARTPTARREPSSPLRDVAGMLRSFDYVVGHAERADAAAVEHRPRLLAWRDGLRAAFLEGYLEAATGTDLLPGEPDAVEVLLGAFELDKAVYELSYELANRPEWVAIPVDGIMRLLAPQTTTTAPNGAAVPSPSAKSPVADSELAPPDGDVERLVAGRHHDPHAILGAHPQGSSGGTSGAVVRVWRPDADSVAIRTADGATVETERLHDAGLYAARLDSQPAPGSYRVVVRYPPAGTREGETYELVDAYAFWPSVGEIDLYLAGEGRHEELWRRLGAHVAMREGITGTTFAVWAPNAASVRVVGDFNSWDGRLHPMRMLGASGIWELFVPDVADGSLYKFELLTADGEVVTRADPFASATETPPSTASRVFASQYEWGDGGWLTRRRAGAPPTSAPMSVYEVHLGSWRHRDGRSLTYRELADDLVGHVTYLGFTHVELLPVAEHPFGGSWGYQVTGYFAPTSRFGTPDDFRYLVDRLHQAGVGVIVDWVPAHFPKDAWALARFDGTALYEHADPRQGEHPDWGTLVFNFGRNEVRNFLISNALFWIEELHVDGLRVDAVASMLYLDYSREEGQWVPNVHGGRENLEAVAFLQELNRVVYGRNPHALMIAEESTAWPGVTRPAHLGGLGFGFKWNMGWMHDSLEYVSKDPIHRRFHHHQMTFALVYAFSENFVLPYSHDEVVHGKRSLLDKMPGDRWQKFANLRALYGYMWAHPGKQLLFMGSEFGQWREWSEERELDWYLLDEGDHAGLQRAVADLNARYRELPALWERDTTGDGFAWIDANDADGNVFSFVRYASDGAPLTCITNFSAVARRQRVGLPTTGRWEEVLNTDAAGYGGSGVGNYGAVTAEPFPCHGLDASAEVTLPPLATLWLRPAGV